MNRRTHQHIDEERIIYNFNQILSLNDLPHALYSFAIL